MAEIAITDGHLAYDDTGAGPVVVLLHAGGLDRRLWAAQTGALPGHRVVVPDLRGFGASSTPRSPFRHDRDVIELLDTLDIEKAVLVGVSMGAQTAVDTALENPARVGAVMISGGGGGQPDWTDPWMIEINRRLAAAESAQRPNDWVCAFLEVLAGPGRSPADLPAELVVAQNTMVRHTLARHITPPILAGQAPIVASPLPDARERLGELAVPVLAAHGALDSPDHLRFAQRVVDAAGGRAVTVQGAAHCPNMERPAEYNALLNDFLASLPSLTR
jgi:pimeloyl-ACP methyl ester carboxylesterase